MSTEDQGLKQAARNYLQALESSAEDSKAKAEKAKDRLAEAAVLWAQAEAIDTVIQKKSIVVEAESEAEARSKALQLIRG